MKNFLMGFVYAGRGIIAAAKKERNFKVMLAVAVATAGLGWYQGISRLEWVALILSFGLVLSLELINTAGERLIDILSPNFDARYGIIKDLLAGGVLLAAIATAVVGALIFLK